MNKRRIAVSAVKNVYTGKSLIMKHFFSIMFATGLLVATSGIAQAKTIVISSIEGSTTPIAEKVMAEAYKQIGMTLEVKRLPAERALHAANNGDVDGDLYRKKDINKSYPNLIVIPVAIVSVDEMIFTKGKKLNIKNWKELLPYSVGYRIGIKVVENSLVKGTRAEAVPTLEQLFLKLDNGRNNVVIETKLSGFQTIAKLGLKNIVMQEEPILKAPLFHCLNIKNKNLVETLTVVLKKMESEGTIKAIQNKAEQEILSSKSQ